MPKRILIDATHVEETRLVILENGRVVEFDSETSIKKQLKGNIYLAKITRVEPSLQAAFVEYGGDKHGFLPFSEIHPDYYNIPVSDKQELLRSIRREMADDDDDDHPVQAKQQRSEKGSEDSDHESGLEEGASDEDSSSPDVDILGGDEPENATSIKSQNLYRKYKIQEVIKRNQIILVQVEKEERGNKGASLTTFISLAGRYCVLMPNSLKRGGVSRRIADREDRKRLKTVIRELEVPEETGIIVRTAGSKRSAEEIKTDYYYLATLWNKIREATLISTAPAFIHGEDDIIKRVIRDFYDENIDEILIEDDEAYKVAKDFMKLVIPKHVSKVKHYRNKVPLFSRYKVEEQIMSLYSQQVSLESGGAIVINPTEALISIDVNSGKSTGQRNVEETALNTNMEAAYEIARQLKLRELSGLIVIDFIDMMDLRNKKSVERALKEAFQDDRAKIQIGRISSFGLLEMSRQRLRASFLEVNTMVCSTCHGSGFIKATESNAVTVLRAIENDVSRSKSCDVVNVSVSHDVAMYILNNKRTQLYAIEKRYGVRVVINSDASVGTDGFYLEKIGNGRGVEDEDQPATNREAPVVEKEAELVLVDGEAESNSSRRDRGRRKKGAAIPEKTAPVMDGNVTVSEILGELWKKIID